MKYIRTKDGRIIDTRGALDSQPTKHNLMRFKSPNWHYNGHKQITIKMDDVIKQADTIEELCDEFVFITENLSSGGYWIIRTYKRAKEIAQSYKEDEINFNCYSAIWTDKGLIYVAKMNEEGKLELL